MYKMKNTFNQVSGGLMKNSFEKIQTLVFLVTFLVFQSIFPQTEQWVSKGIGAGGGLFMPAVNPHNISEYFVPTDMGALFHSTNKGSGWNVINFKQIVPSIHSAMQFTSDPNILYAISGWDFPESVKSTDGGNTWNTLAADPTGQEALYIFADDSQTNRLIVSNYFNIYFSNNGGNSFTQIYSTTDDSGIHIGGVYWDGNVILIGTNFGVLESTNNGSSFSINSNLVLPSDEGISSFTGSKQNGVTRLYCVTLNKNDIYGGMTGAEFYGYKGVYKTSYGSGNNWIKISNSLPSNLRFYFIASAKNSIDIAYIAGGDVNTSFPIVYKTTDGGNTWSDNFKTNNNENIYTGWSGYHGDKNWWYGEYALGLTVPSNNPNVVVMTDLGFVHSSTDGGATWYQNYVNTSDQNPPNQPTPKGNSYHGIGIENTSVWWLTWLNSNEIFASFTDITGIKSDDGGESWNMDYSGLDINSVYMVLKSSNNQKLYAATSSVHDMYQETRLEDNPIDNGTGDIRVSSDNGHTWQVLHDFGRPVVWIAFDPSNPNKMYASVVNSTTGGIYKCENIETNPNTWTKLTNPPRTEGHPFNIQILNDGTLVVTYSGRIDTATDNFTASSGVFISTDDGVSWLDRSHDDMKYWSKDVIIDPGDNSQNTWYVCVNSGWGSAASNLGGLYKTTDRGLTWTNILDLFRVESCTINPNNHNEMFVTTYDEGLWQTQNLNLASPEFSSVDSYPFKHPMRVFFNPFNSGETWITSFGNGLRVGNVTSKVLLQTKIFLEGPYNSTTHQMDANLGSNIPKTSPYPEDPRTVSSIPADVVDWVLVQLRKTDTGDAIVSKSALLHKDGRVVADDGTTGEIELNAPEGNYYIVIKHRNHLAVMSANAIPLNGTTSTLYDFTTGSNKYYGSSGSKQLE